MSTDWSIYCPVCRVETHLGQDWLSSKAALVRCGGTLDDLHDIEAALQPEDISGLYGQEGVYLFRVRFYPAAHECPGCEALCHCDCGLDGDRPLAEQRMACLHCGLGTDQPGDHVELRPHWSVETSAFLGPLGELTQQSETRARLRDELGPLNRSRKVQTAEGFA